MLQIAKDLKFIKEKVAKLKTGPTNYKYETLIDEEQSLVLKEVRRFEAQAETKVQLNVNSYIQNAKSRAN